MKFLNVVELAALPLEPIFTVFSLFSIRWRRGSGRGGA